MEKLNKQLQRVLPDLVLVLLVMVMFVSRIYERFPPPLQLVALKSLLVSAGILAAHLSGKLLFPPVEWDGKMSPAHYARIALYLVCVYAYSVGG